MASTISHSEYQRVIQSAANAAEAVQRLDGLSDLRLACQRTGESQHQPSVEFDDLMDSHVSAGCKFPRDQRPACDLPLVAVTVLGRKNGQPIEIYLGEYTSISSAAQMVAEELRCRRLAADRLQNAADRLTARVASGELVISPTAAEERAARAARAAISAEQTRHNKARFELRGARQRLAAYRRDEAAYRRNGHAIDQMIADEQARIAECEAILARKV